MRKIVGAQSVSKQTLNTNSTLDISFEVTNNQDSNAQGNTQAVDTVTITLAMIALFIINKQSARLTSNQPFLPVIWIEDNWNLDRYDDRKQVWCHIHLPIENRNLTFLVTQGDYASKIQFVCSFPQGV